MGKGQDLDASELSSSPPPVPVSLLSAALLSANDQCIQKLQQQSKLLGQPTIGRGDFRKIFRIFFATSVASWVTELWKKIMILFLKKNFSPWKKFQFSREIIYKGGKFNIITKVNINKNINVKLKLLELLSDWIINISHIFSFDKALIGLLYARK